VQEATSLSLAKKKELQTKTIEKIRHILKKIGKKNTLAIGKNIEQIIQNIPKETETFKKDETKRGKVV
jgi:tRNA(Ser,Leu) C12 N-acetylase TAN1